MKKLTTLVVMVATLAASICIAQAQGKKGAKFEPVTITGKLTKKVRTWKNKNGEQKEHTIFTLTDADGKAYTLIAPRAKKGEAALDMGTLADKNVTVEGVGRTITRKTRKGEVTVNIVRVKSIKEAPETPAEN